MCSTKPIYLAQDYNYVVSGDPTDYLTNSIEKWRQKQPPRNRRSDEMFRVSGHCNAADWQNKCLLKVNPALAALDVTPCVLQSLSPAPK